MVFPFFSKRFVESFEPRLFILFLSPFPPFFPYFFMNGSFRTDDLTPAFIVLTFETDPSVLGSFWLGGFFCFFPFFNQNKGAFCVMIENLPNTLIR